MGIAGFSFCAMGEDRIGDRGDRLIGPKRCGFNSFSSDFAEQITDTKKPAGLAPCGLSGLLRMTLESSSKDFGGAGGI
jgi:hypothetical protein